MGPRGTGEGPRTQVYELVQPTAVMGQCGAIYTGAESWRCLFGQYRMPFLTARPAPRRLSARNRALRLWNVYPRRAD